MKAGIVRRAVGVGIVIAAGTAVAALSGVPSREAADQSGLIRLSWRARGEQIRVCRRLAPEERAKLPAHMRQEEVCTRHIVPYRLQVVIDSTVLLVDTVRAGGAHEDRPLFVFDELPVASGSHRLAITFEHIPGTAPYREAEEDPAHETRETPPLLKLEESVVIAPRAILLVTYDDESGALRVIERRP